jgi:hypothetical protein
MNIFQKQLIFSNGKTQAESFNEMIEEENDSGGYWKNFKKVELAPSPQSITMEEFEKIMRKSK